MTYELIVRLTRRPSRETAGNAGPDCGVPFSGMRQDALLIATPDHAKT